MKSIVSWTQTYGDKRLLNIKLLKYDVIGNKIRNDCKYIIFSFHNCPNSFFKEALEILKSIYDNKKLIFIKYDDCTYLECLRKILRKIEELNCTDILQIQDDQHGINSVENISNIHVIDNITNSYCNNEKIQFLHLFSDEGLPNEQLVPIETIKLDDLDLYKYDSRDFKKYKNIYSWNDGTYLININFLGNLINDNNIPQDVWNMELYLNYQFQNIPFFRWGSNKVLFKASNLFGRNINRRMSVEDNLFRFFGELDKWNEIKSLII